MKNASKTYKVFIYICLFALAVSILIPVAWVFMASIKENSEFYQNAWSLPKGFHWQNFSNAWTEAKMGEYFLNSIVSTGLGLVLLLVFGIPAAYVLSRLEFKGVKFWNGYLHAGLFVNISYIVIPIFLMLLDWNKILGTKVFLNNNIMLALIYASTAFPFTIYLLANYFRSISKTYEEAAYIDGAGYFRTMIDIMVPMAKPSIITVILFNFLAFWNEYILALTICSGSGKTLPVGLVNLQQAARGKANYGVLYAGLVLVMLPTLILYIMVQKQLTEGMMVGGDKG
ncbi:MAG: carbohydrate ABC transporter permease [Tissierellia bacterium]|nr:carbohydrate ABC transporter permease [Tissierellia bacterium]